MSGSRAQHLQRRSGIFHLRIRVPADIRSLVGLTEVRRSLHTYQSSRARILAAVCAARVFEMFKMVRTKELSKDQVRGLVCNLMTAMEREVEGAAATRLSDWERNEQLYCSSEMTATVRAQRVTAARSGEVRGAAWTEIDVENALWIIPKERMKAQREHVVPLSKPALRIIERCSQLRTVLRSALAERPSIIRMNTPFSAHRFQRL